MRDTLNAARSKCGASVVPSSDSAILRRSLAFAISPPAPGIERHEMRPDVDMDVAHVGVRHDAAGGVVGDQPAYDIAFAGPGVEVDRLAGGMPGDAARTGDPRAGAAGGDDA